MATSPITDLLYLDAVRLQDAAGNGYDLTPADSLQNFRRLANLDHVKGMPVYWAAVPGATPPNIYLGPRADRVYTLVVDYVKTAADFAAAGDTETVIPQTFKSAVVWKAIEHMCFRRGDPQGLGMASQMYTNEVLKLASQESMGDRQRADEVVSSGFWDAYDPEVCF